MSDIDRGPPEFSPERLFYRHHEPLRRYLVRLTGDPELAADAAQEAFVRLLGQQPPPEQARAWLFRVATNLVRDDARKAHRHAVLGASGRTLAAHGDAPRAPDAVVEQNAARALVNEALRALSPKERQALLMREEGFAHREIAEALDTTTGSIGTLLRRAIGKAARRLGVPEER